MLNKYDYSFNYENSYVHRMNPLFKLFSLFIYILIWLLKFNNYLFIFSLSYVFLLLLISNVKLRKYIKILWKFKFLLFVIGYCLYSQNVNISEIGILLFRIVFLILHVFLIIFTTTKSQMVRSLGWCLDRFNIIGLNKKKIYNFVDNIYIFVFSFINLFNDTIIYKESIGIDYVHGNLFGKCKVVFCNFKQIFKLTKNKVENNQEVKKYRLYDERVISQYKYVNKLCLLDYLVLIINVGMVIFYVMKVK